MSDVDGLPGFGTHRIGDTERDAATAALNVHREAGRIDAVEYEDRQVTVSRARTWADIQPLFLDLPEPHPVGMPVEPVSTSLPVASTRQAPQAVRPHPQGTVMALTPFAAVALFFLTGSWIWFLAIPVMGILLYGADGDEQRRFDARSQRREWRRDRREWRQR